MSKAIAAVAAGDVKYPKNQPIELYALVNSHQDKPRALTRKRP